MQLTVFNGSSFASVFSFKYLTRLPEKHKTYGLVAQWLEHTLDKRGVESSTLSRPTIIASP
jgi:hypothetical protein